MITKHSMIFDAIKLVAGAHYGQFRKGTNLPYIVHPLNVMTILINSGCSNEVITAGILHDVIEDSEVSIDEIKDQFGAKVAALVTGASENRDNFDESDGKSSWKQRKQHTIEFLIHEADFEQLQVSCADKLDNMIAICNDYEKIGEKLWERFNAGKELQKWYYTSLVEAFEKRANQLGEPLFSLSLKFKEKVGCVF